MRHTLTEAGRGNVCIEPMGRTITEGTPSPVQRFES